MTSPGVAGPAQLKQAYEQINQRIAEAANRAGRRPDDVLMVAVTKYATPDQIRQIVELGHADLGESRVQQLQQRAPQLNEFLARKRTLAAAASKADDRTPQKVRWHMIGHLQRNKAKAVAPLVSLIHSVDSLRLAEELHALGARHEATYDVLLQVNTAGEAGKFGVAAPAAVHLAEQIDSMVHLRLRGVMTMAPHTENPEDARPVFARTADIFREIAEQKLGGSALTVLSMGMTNDFEVAIEEGANVVRIGTSSASAGRCSASRKRSEE